MSGRAEPLLQKQQKDEGGATITATCINLLKNMIGAGLLNVCVAFQYASVLGGLLSMLFCAFVSTAGFLLIGWCCAKTNAKTFRELFKLSIGPKLEWIVDVILFFHTLFSCVGYVTLIGDFAQKSAHGLFPNSVFAEDRKTSIFVITVVGLFPLSLLQNLNKLKYTSAVGLVVTAFACIYVFQDCLSQSSTLAETVREKWWYVNGMDIFKTIALFNGSFSAHYNAPTYYAELKNQSFERYAKASLYSFAFATLLFTAFGIAGFARFGDEVLGNVLKNYSADDPFIQISWLCMMLSTIFVFPHAFQRMRSSFVALFGVPSSMKKENYMLITTIGLLALSVFFGVAFDDIAVIKMIKGATLGVSIMFILPGAIYLYLTKQSANFPVVRGEPVGNMRVFCWVLIVTGITQGSLAILRYVELI